MAGVRGNKCKRYGESHVPRRTKKLPCALCLLTVSFCFHTLWYWSEKIKQQSPYALGKLCFRGFSPPPPMISHHWYSRRQWLRWISLNFPICLLPFLGFSYLVWFMILLILPSRRNWLKSRKSETNFSKTRKWVWKSYVNRLRYFPLICLNEKIQTSVSCLREQSVQKEYPSNESRNHK